MTLSLFQFIKRLLFKDRYLHFFVTGVSGITLNLFITWALTTFVFGLERYFTAYLIGAAVNLIYNFLIYSFFIFRTTKNHGTRLAIYLSYSFANAAVQIASVRLLTALFGKEYYLIIIASVIFLLSVFSFLLFKLALFRDWEKRTIKERMQQLEEGARRCLFVCHARLLLALPYWQKIRNSIAAHTKADHQWIVILMLLAMLLRLPFISHPERTVFDEVIYTNYTLHTLQGVPFFDIHPPLARMLFTQIAKHSGEITTTVLPTDVNQPFADFPFVSVRYFIAFMSILIPILLYATGRIMHFSPRMAAIPALFLIFDNAFIIYGRVILPDTLLILFNFLAFAAALAAVRVRKKRFAFALILIASIAIGFAVAIKWTALGVFATICFLFFLHKRWSAIFITGIATLLIYLSVFVVNFSFFPNGGPIKFLIPPYTTSWLSDMAYPKGTDEKAVLQFLPEFHQAILRSNNDPMISKFILQGPGPLSWSVARTSITFWVGNDGKRIILQGSAFLWFFSFFLLLFEIGWILTRLKMKRVWPIDRDETVLLAGYFLNYLPFFLIHRPMYLYHYLTALVFLFLLIPKIGPRVIACIGNVSGDMLFARVLGYTVIFFAFVNFLLLFRTTYGV